MMENTYLETVASRDEWIWHYRHGISTSKTLAILREETWFQVNQKSRLQMKCVKNVFKQSNTKTTSTKMQEVILKPLLRSYTQMCMVLFMQIRMEVTGTSFTCIHDFSKKLWIYLIKKKSDMIEVFTKFKYMVEIQSVHKIKTLRIDDGGEYV